MLKRPHQAVPGASVLRANLRSSGARLWAAGAAIAISVAFIVTGMLLVASFTQSVEEEAAADAAGADLIIDTMQLVWDEPEFDQQDEGRASPAAELAETIDELDSVATAETRREVYLGYEGDADQASPGFTGQLGVSELGESVSSEVAQGREPENEQEAVISEVAAEAYDLSVGDQLTFEHEVLPDEAEPETGEAEVHRTDYEIVGVLDTAGGPRGFITVDGMDRLPMDPMPQEIRVVLPAQAHGDAAAQEAAQLEIEAIIAQLDLDVDVLTHQQIIDEWVADRTGGASFLLYIAFGFGAVAIFVSALVISNTFQVIIASRTRTMALLRAIGASPAQLRRATLAEGAVLGLVGGLLGLVLGWALSAGLALLFNALLDGNFTPVGLTLPAAAAGLGLGLVMAAASALVPALKAGRVSPVEALRPADVAPPESPVSRLRLVLGVLLTVVGLGMVTYSGLVTPVQPEGDFGVDRDPILGVPLPVLGIGGAFLGFLGVLLIARVVFPPLVSVLGRGAAAAGIAKVPATLAGQNARQVPGRIAATASALLVGVTLVVTMTVGAATAQKLLFDELAESYPVDIEIGTVEEELTAGLEDAEAVTEVRTEAGTTQAWVIEDISETQAHALLEDLQLWLPEAEDDVDTTGMLMRAGYSQAIDMVLGVVLLLLAASVIVAVIGVSNTLSLSVFERRREAALLRAVGMTRRQVGSMVSIEALLLAAVALILGTALGVLFGWAGVSTLARADWNVVVDVPWLRVAAIWAVTLLAALLAAWLPARRLGRVEPAAGLSQQ